MIMASASCAEAATPPSHRPASASPRGHAAPVCRARGREGGPEGAGSRNAGLGEPGLSFTTTDLSLVKMVEVEYTQLQHILYSHMEAADDELEAHLGSALLGARARWTHWRRRRPVPSAVPAAGDGAVKEGAGNSGPKGAPEARAKSTVRVCLEACFNILNMPL